VPQIEIEDLKVTKGKKLICHMPQMSVESGEQVAIFGANGVGKTTLMLVLAGFERDHQGACNISTALRSRSFMHQTPYLFRGTVLHNVMYGLRSHGIDSTKCRRIADEWLDRFAIADIAQARCANLSGGERKRVALARALAMSPQLLLLDEPFAEVDEAGVSLMSEVLSDLQSTTVVFTSATPLSSDVRARVVEMKTPADTTSSPVECL